MLHRFREQTDGITIPRLFTWPFHYTPHQLCRMATAQVQEYISIRRDWHRELQSGKMFGVLVVSDTDGNLGFLAAFSGNLAGKNSHKYFVPPIYDALQPDDFFRRGEALISQINHKIDSLLSSDSLRQARQELDRITDEAESTLAEMKATLAQRKSIRDMRRANGEDNAPLIAESQRDKADMHRAKIFYKERTALAQAAVDKLMDEINVLKEERKLRSAQLQMELFSQYRLLNARGEIRDICDIFAPTPQRIPPAGAGECAAPKLLQHAYLNGLQPIAMSEFWWGDSPKGEIRRHGNFYPSCTGKCKPILLYMMQGLDVEPDPMAAGETFSPQILWEDPYIVIINKPAGMLSVNGKTGVGSAEQWARDRYPSATGTMIVHRLDQATSGILVIAKSKDIHRTLQSMFAGRHIRKSYVALLDGILSVTEGEIRLPLKPDYDHRPRQMVADDGKTALTRYQVIGIENGRTKIRFYPITGRTHQLRVHAAHADGLGTPITGDALYGIPAERMYLHAEHIEFVHPVTGETISITCRPDF